MPAVILGHRAVQQPVRQDGKPGVKIKAMCRDRLGKVDQQDIASASDKSPGRADAFDSATLDHNRQQAARVRGDVTLRADDGAGPRCGMAEATVAKPLCPSGNCGE